METVSWTRQLFQSIDGKDTNAFLSFLHDDVEFRFGNAAPVFGKAAVGEAVRGFFSSIKEVHHELKETWCERGVIICHGTVSYTRHDSTALSVPFANILNIENNRVNKYLVFVDVSELYATA